ncbi:hypothetical protein A3I27_04000 [Candidatus Giovannonibacteria bacterium RIFCSPLOWO2_02_FULL_43_11b]|uniref:N-acetyltransferase domain-containing protein n=2 Tax=Parcubacteria group TaxID=1794811 RepID=A0A1F6W8F0_9BACT|nr:MAG: hypothetical protein A3F23_00495 [Candidatus Giovannonibacteria bacterium RIFCSPHIGHO2_12_FULL_43_15]OGF90424.1 MAG: hypothetical protein A3I27_04000 [Candidatus Giovannonibacteria bacterium RIFCSPLOWO2_02_FULL_43_11b]OGF91764.1 MAG: hypothetical protein A3H04_01005 [Candidatus Giovannonibacteria bacterium RIFCSPLOWO2_12_FULL_43_11c]OGI77965.1 MAG: hypothetical protein A3D42_03410 [Candidatus Nomurabacteria bacterium RIFCSPHIGHO2_02_FULL_41_18]OGI90050.1 MAG: hypothetical protein A3B01_
MNISLVRFGFDREIRAGLIESLISCYRDVFAFEPWSEWLKCQACSKSWGREQEPFLVSRVCPTCVQPLQEFWPADQVLRDLKKEITADASCWLAINHELEVVGFSWGYPITIRALEEKLDIQLSQSLSHYYGCCPDTVVGYQDEVGVRKDYRGIGIAHDMIDRRNDDLVAQGIKIAITRTRQFPGASLTYQWYSAAEYIKVAKYPCDDGRVIQATTFEGLKERLRLKPAMKCE